MEYWDKAKSEIFIGDTNLAKENFKEAKLLLPNDVGSFIIMVVR